MSFPSRFPAEILVCCELKIKLPAIALLQKFSDNQIMQFCKIRDVVIDLGPYVSSRLTGIVLLIKELALRYQAGRKCWYGTPSDAVTLPALELLKFAML